MSENTDEKFITTAEALGKYNKELAEQGFNQEMREALVLKASVSLLDSGLAVKA